MLQLPTVIQTFEAKIWYCRNYIFYLSTPPSCMSRSQKNLYEEGLTKEDEGGNESL